MIQFMASTVPKMSLAALGTRNKHVQSSARCQKAEISHLPFHVYDSCKATQINCYDLFCICFISTIKNYILCN